MKYTDSDGRVEGEKIKTNMWRRLKIADPNDRSSQKEKKKKENDGVKTNLLL